MRLRNWHLPVVLGLTAVLVTACAPAAGRPAVQYRAQAPDVLSAIAEIAVTMQPGSSYDYYSVERISDRSIRLRADTVPGISFFFGQRATVIAFSASQNGEVVTLAATTNNDLGRKSIDQILERLDGRYQRVVRPL